MTRHSETRTPWAVVCPEHGTVFLIQEEYDKQLAHPDGMWECPLPGCGMTSAWDDANYELGPNVNEDLADTHREDADAEDPEEDDLGDWPEDEEDDQYYDEDEEGDL